MIVSIEMRCMICGEEMERENVIHDKGNPIAEMWRCPKCQSGFRVDLANRWVGGKKSEW